MTRKWLCFAIGLTVLAISGLSLSCDKEKKEKLKLTLSMKEVK